MKNIKKMSKDETIAVVGLGYVGLPTMIAFYESGFKVIGVDISEEVISNLKKGINPLIDSTDELKIPTNSDNWKVTTEYIEAIPHSDIIIITVPTPVNEDKSPNLDFVNMASKQIIKNLNYSKDTTIILESTVYPGVTREIIGNELIHSDIDNNKVEIAYCPERVSPGDIGKGISNIARILGCNSKKKGIYLAELYSLITTGGCKYVGKIEIAEAAKLIENVQRDIDIAFTNELARILPKMGLDVEEVLDAASTKWNFHRHTPGIGVGGHCIPVDPYYYISMSDKLGENATMSIAAREINTSMPNYVANSVKDILNDIQGNDIFIMGYSYKPELGDIRETPVEELIKKLTDGGNKVTVWDPYVSPEKMPKEVRGIESLSEIGLFDIIILATAHKKCINIDWTDLLNKSRSKIIYDGRRALKKEKMELLGWQYMGIGIE